MKSFMFCLLSLVLLASCGKDNESGKSNNGYYPGGYGNPYTTPMPGYGNINSPYAYGGVSVNQIFQHHPCTVTPGLPQARMTVQLPVTLGNRYLASTDFFVGVTSVGDVAVLVGQNSNQALLIGYLCQRSIPLSQPTLLDLAYSASSQCVFKQLTRATIGLPGLPTPLFFRPLEGRSSTGAPFPFCSP